MFSFKGQPGFKKSDFFVNTNFQYLKVCTEIFKVLLKEKNYIK